MLAQDSIILTKTDFHKILSLLNLAPSSIGQLLEEELGRALLVSDDELPDNVVGMNSLVRFEYLDDAKQSSITLVYPLDANIEENKISILTPIGSALIGLRVGQVIRWPFPNGKEKQLKVLSVSSQQRISHE